MDNLTQKCQMKELNEKAEYLTEQIREIGYITVKRKITMCDVCSGYEPKCKGYVPTGNLVDGRFK